MTSSTHGEHQQELDKLTREELISQYEKKVSDMAQLAEYGTTNEERRAYETKKPPPQAPRTTTGI